MHSIALNRKDRNVDTYSKIICKATEHWQWMYTLYSWWDCMILVTWLQKCGHAITVRVDILLPKSICVIIRTANKHINSNNYTRNLALNGIIETVRLSKHFSNYALMQWSSSYQCCLVFNLLNQIYTHNHSV